MECDGEAETIEAVENLKKAEFNFMLDSKTLIYETSVDLKLLQQKKQPPEEISPGFNELSERFGMLLAGDKIVIPEELKT